MERSSVALNSINKSILSISGGQGGSGRSYFRGRRRLADKQPRERQQLHLLDSLPPYSSFRGWKNQN